MWSKSSRQVSIFNHPDWNHTDLPWNDSQNGKAWKARGEDVLPPDKQLNSTQPPQYEKVKIPKKQGTSLDTDIAIIATMHDKLSSDLIHAVLQHDHLSLKVQTLLDTGALQGNYISRRVADELNIRSTGPRIAIGSALRQKSVVSMCNAVVNLIYLNELTNSTDTITIPVTIIDMPFDLIIGKPTLKEHSR